MELNNITSAADPEKWKMAKKRVAFKYHLLIYFLINIFLWLMWYTNIESTLSTDRSQFPWPFWETIICGIGIIYNYIATYGYKISLLKRNIES